MTPQTRPPVHRPTLKRMHPALAVCLMLVLLFSGCVHNQLYQFQKHAAGNDHEWIAAQTIACQEASDGCSQLHLIKATACFHLAQAGRNPVVDYACAAAELEKGVALRPFWENADVQLQFQEKLCEALNHLKDLQSGESSKQTLNRLMEAAQALYQLAPERIPAVYYLSGARLSQMMPLLFDLNHATRIPVCYRLKRTLSRVLSMMETAKETPLPDWDRFAEKYQRLAFDLGSAVHTAECR